MKPPDAHQEVERAEATLLTLLRLRRGSAPATLYACGPANAAAAHARPEENIGYHEPTAMHSMSTRSS